jgi:cellulose synthase operon protein C
VASEDPGLHARIDVYRDIFKDKNRPLDAEEGLQGLLNAGGLELKPRARFRILTNLGSIALHLGREAEAIDRYEAAHAVRPTDPQAKANLALARVLQERFDEAMVLAQEALAGEPRAEHAIGYLLQAAERSGWKGEPEALVPRDLVGTVHADLGLAVFHNRRAAAGWQERCIALAQDHPGVAEFTPIHAVAVLSLAIDSSTAQVGGIGPVTTEVLKRAADEMKAFTERMLDSGFAYEYDRRAHLNNTCVLLRLCGRDEEAVTLLRRAGAPATGDATLHRLLALALMTLGRSQEAIDELAVDPTPEGALFRAELVAASDLTAALAIAKAVTPDDLAPGMARNRWHVIADLALRAKQPDALADAIAGLRRLVPNDPAADVFALRGERLQGLAENKFRERLCELARGVSSDLPFTERVLLAVEMRNANCPNEASRLLDGRVDLARVTPTAIMFLQCLGQARRDDAFREALASASPDLRQHPAVLWATAAHAWNTGDLPGAYHATSALIKQDPNSGRVRLFRLEILLRQDRTADLKAELVQPLETLSWPRVDDSFQLARLLAHFDFGERAARFAYRLYLENRQNPLAWMTLSALVLGERPGLGDRSLEVSVVAPDTAVNLTYDDGRTQFFVIEPDQHLRDLDDESWEPEHPSVQPLMGLSKGQRFTDAAGRTGMIADLRHKLVARFHYVLSHYEARFPTERGFRSISVAPNEPGGLDEMIDILRTRNEWARQEQEQYAAGALPVGLLAARSGLDTIDVAEGLAAEGIKLKVALGNKPERQTVRRTIRDNAARGCVLDLMSFWTAWKLGVLDTIVATCGPIHVCQKLFDHLMGRRERLRHGAREGSTNAGYRDGKLVVHEVPPEIVQGWLSDLDNAITWLDANAVVSPLVVSADLPEKIREHVSLGLSDIFDGLIISWQNDLLLITDDLPLRQIGNALGFKRSCWTHAVLLAARDGRQLDTERYVRCTAHAIAAGHSFITVNGDDLAVALRLDAESGQAPGQIFDALSAAIGGRNADPSSHTNVVIRFL